MGNTKFTTEDVQFWYEDIILNEELTPEIPTWLAPGGEPLTVVVEDDFTFRFEFAVPYSSIIDTLTDLGPWAPKHYLSQWHINHNDQADELARSENFDTWFEAFFFHADHIGETQLDADLPVLGAWKFESKDAQGNTLYVRNPYYLAVDPEGNQLPYVDYLEKLVVGSHEVLTANVLAGGGTHHCWYLTLADFPLYKQNEEAGNYTTRLHPDLRASEFGFIFNYTHKDLVLRELFNDIRWRQALSHAINRDDINEIFFAGLGVPRQGIMHPGPAFYEEGIDQYYTEYNVELANQLLDEVIPEYDSGGKFRLRPDGEPLVVTMEILQGEANLTEIAELIQGYWAEVGVNLKLKGYDAALLRQRAQANEQDIGVSAIGGSSEPYSRKKEPIRYRPPWHWPFVSMGGLLWRVWLDTDGAEGVEPPDIIKELWDITVEWQAEPFGTDRYNELGRKMLQINAENLWQIGTVGLVPKVSIIDNNIRNHPIEGDIISVELGYWYNHRVQQWWIERSQ